MPTQAQSACSSAQSARSVVATVPAVVDEQGQHAHSAHVDVEVGKVVAREDTAGEQHGAVTDDLEPGCRSLGTASSSPIVPVSLLHC